MVIIIDLPDENSGEKCFGCLKPLLDPIKVEVSSLPKEMERFYKPQGITTVFSCQDCITIIEQTGELPVWDSRESVKALFNFLEKVVSH